MTTIDRQAGENDVAAAVLAGLVFGLGLGLIAPERLGAGRAGGTPPWPTASGNSPVSVPSRPTVPERSRPRAQHGVPAFPTFPGTPAVPGNTPTVPVSLPGRVPGNSDHTGNTP